MQQSGAVPESEPRLIVLLPDSVESYQTLYAATSYPHAIFCRATSSKKTLMAQIMDACHEQALPLSDTRYLWLDDCDVIDDQSLHQTVNELLSAHSELCIYLKTRTLPVKIINDPDLQQILSYQHSHSDARQHLTLIQQSDQHVIHAQAFGNGQVWVNGRLIQAWDGVLPFLLFFYIVDHGMVTRDMIFQTFWHWMPKSEATNIFHVTKRKLNEILGVTLTQFSANYYHIASNISLSYDVNDFTQILQEALYQSDDPSKLLAASNLYKGAYLAGYESPWILDKREKLLGIYTEMTYSLAEYNREHGKPEAAVGMFAQVLGGQPQYQQAAYALMSIYKDMQLFDDAIAVYSRLVQALHKQHKIPDRLITRLYQEIVELAQNN